MHMIIKILVYAYDEDNAVGEARYVLDSLCDKKGCFNYYATFDEQQAIRRWGELPKVTKVCTYFGSEKCNNCDERFHCYTTQMNLMLEEAMQKTKDDFFKNLDYIKQAIATRNDDQLFEDDDFQYRCHQAGEYQGSCVWLYDQDGDGIRNTEHLKDVLKKWGYNSSNGKSNALLEKKDIFIVPADVHY